MKIRKEIRKKEQNVDIVDKIMKNIQILSTKYKKSVDLDNVEEFSRRFSVLSRSFVSNCLNIMNETLRKLRISLSSATLAAKIVRVMEVQAVVIPEIGVSECVLVRERVAKLIEQTMNEIIKERLIFIQNGRHFRIETVNHGRESFSSKKSRVMVNDSADIIGESAYPSFDELVGNLAGTSHKRSNSMEYNEPHVSISFTQTFTLLQYHNFALFSVQFE